MRTLIALLVSAALTAACADAPDPDPGGADGDDAAGPVTEAEALRERASAIADPEARRVWTRMMEEIAPDDGWGRTRYLAFDWMVQREGGPLRRSHRWDTWEGRYRVEAPVGEGDTLVALFDVDDPTAGRAWVDGERVEGPRADSLLERAHAMFINDSYWLLMPFKWADPGVTATYLGEMEEWGETWEVVELTFDSVGLTPRNKYRAFVDPETGVMGLWQHYREADQEEPNFTMAWTEWSDRGPIRLSTARPNEEGESRIWFENVEASTEVPEGAFEPPSDGSGGGS